MGLGGTVPAEPTPLIVTLSGAFYSRRTLADFALSPIPETGLSFGKGGAWDAAVKQLPRLEVLALVDSIDVAWDWNTDIPAIGSSKDSTRLGRLGDCDRRL